MNTKNKQPVKADINLVFLTVIKIIDIIIKVLWLDSNDRMTELQTCILNWCLVVEIL